MQTPQTETPIHDAASLVIYKRGDDGAVSVLMGRRSASAVFLPNKFVFPGGRVEASDSIIPGCEMLPLRDQALLAMKCHAALTNPNALAMTAIRETYEETGIVIGQPAQTNFSAPTPAWDGFITTGYVPEPSQLHFFARAITPPDRPRRFDTRFFCVSAEHISTHAAKQDQELSDIKWIDLQATSVLEVASITKLIFKDLMRLLGPQSGGPQPQEIPFYFYGKSGFERAALSHQDGLA